MPTITAEQAIKKISAQAERIKNDETQRFPEAASPGDSHRQGDIYTPSPSLSATAEKHPQQMAPELPSGSCHRLDNLSRWQAVYRLPEPWTLTADYRAAREP